MLNEIYENTQEHMAKSIESMKRDFSTLRTGKVTTAIIDNIKVDTIEKAIQEANIGVNPNNDGDFIKLFFPPMTVEQRHEIVKQAKVMSEKAKVAIRNIRKDSNDSVKKLEKDKDISEDEMKKGLERVQKITDEYVAKVEDTLKAKEADILKV